MVKYLFIIVFVIFLASTLLGQANSDTSSVVSEPEQDGNPQRISGCTWYVTPAGGSQSVLPSNYIFWLGSSYTISGVVSGLSSGYCYAVGIYYSGGGFVASPISNKTSTTFSFTFGAVPGQNGTGYRFKLFPQYITNSPIAATASNPWNMGPYPTLNLSGPSSSSYIQNNTFTLTWSVSGGITGLSYGGWSSSAQLRFQWYQGSTPLANISPNVNLTNWSRTITADKPAGTNYRIGVCNVGSGSALPDGIPSAFSSYFQITTPLQLPPAPSLSSPSNYAIMLNQTPHNFSWSAVSGYSVDQYQIYVDNNSGFGDPEINQTTTSTSLSSSNVLPHNIYFWKVRAHNATGWGNFSASRQFIADQPPSPPTLTSPSNGATINPNSSINFQWNSSPDNPIARYNIRIVAGTNINAAPVYNQEPNSLSHSVSTTGWAPGTYTWCIRAIKSTPNSANYPQLTYEQAISWGGYNTRTFVLGSLANNLSISQSLSCNPTRSLPETIFALPNLLTEYGGIEPFENEKNFKVDFTLRNNNSTSITLDEMLVVVTGGVGTGFTISYGQPVTLAPGQISNAFDKRGYIGDNQLSQGNATTYAAQIKVRVGSEWFILAGVGSNCSFTVYPRPGISNFTFVKRPRNINQTEADYSAIYFTQYGRKWHGETAAFNNLFPSWGSQIYVYPASTINGIGSPSTPAHDATIPKICGRNFLYEAPSGSTYIIEPEPGTSSPLKSRWFVSEDAFDTYGYSAGALEQESIDLTNDNQLTWIQQQYPVGSNIVAPSANLVMIRSLTCTPTRTDTLLIYSLPSKSEYGEIEPFETEKNIAAKMQIKNSGSASINLNDIGVLVTGGNSTDFRVPFGSPITLGVGQSTPLFDVRGYIMDNQLINSSITSYTAQVQVLIGTGWQNLTGPGSSCTFTVCPRPPLKTGMFVKRPRNKNQSGAPYSTIYLTQFGRKWQGEYMALDSLYPDWETEFYVYPAATINALAPPAVPNGNSTIPIFIGRNLLYETPSGATYIIEPEPNTSSPLKSRWFVNEAAFDSYGYSPGALEQESIDFTTISQVNWIQQQYPVGSNISNGLLISGYCKDYDTPPVAISGVTVSLSNISDLTTTTNDAGYFQINVPQGWSGNLHVSKLGWIFNNQYLSYNHVNNDLVNQNFSSKLAPPNISFDSETNIVDISSDLGRPSDQIFKFTTNNATPNCFFGSLYNGPFSLTSQSTVSSVIYVNGKPGTLSDVSSATLSPCNYEPPIISFSVFRYDTSHTIRYVQLITDSSFILRQIDENGNAIYTLSDLSPKIDASIQITQIKLLDENMIPVGHLPFNYTNHDLRETTPSLVINANLYMHGVHTPYQSPNGGSWDYYQQGEHMVSMLVKPPMVHSQGQPVILVHGINGEYPYWNPNFISGIQSDYDVWDFYYPNNQQIEVSADLLGNAITKVLATPYSQGTKVSLVTHSMGGLVARYYIQKDTSDIHPYVRKLAMCGTPNHGSYGSHRLYRNEILDQVIYKLYGNDPDAPSIEQMAPGSKFLNDLNSIAPKQLMAQSSLKRTYLVIAGTVNNYYKLHDETVGFDDFVVSVSSASLLEFEIPLITTPKYHQTGSGLAGGFSHHIVLNFLHSEYAPTVSAPRETHFQNIYSNVDAAGIRMMQNNTLHDIKTDLWSNPKHGSLNIAFDKQFNIEDFKCFVAAGNLFCYPNFNHPVSISNYVNPNTKYCKLENSSRYTSTNGLKYSNYLFVNPEPFPIGDNLNIVVNDISYPYNEANYRVILYNKQNLCAYTSVPMKINKFNSNNLRLPLSHGQVFTLNATGSILASFTGWRQESNGRSLIQKYYPIDDQAESIVFYIKGDSSSVVINNFGFTLVSPSGTIIDSTYISNQTNMEYHENLENAYAYIYISNPEPGSWILQYNDEMQIEDTYALVDDELSMSMQLSQINATVGETITVSISTPENILPENCLITASLSRDSEPGQSINLGNIPLIYDTNNLRFGGSFVVYVPSQYNIEINGNFTMQGNAINRNIVGHLNVMPIGNSTPVLPEQDSIQRNNPTQFVWTAARNAISYVLSVYSDNSQISDYQISTIDTTYSIADLPSNTEFRWFVTSQLDSLNHSISSFGYFSTGLSRVTCINPLNSSTNNPQVVDLEWQAIEGADLYHLQFATDPDFTFCPVNDSLLTSLVYEVSGLSSNQTYYWRVRTINDSGQGEWSETSSFTVRSYTVDFPSSIQMLEDEQLVLSLPRYIDDYHPNHHEVSISSSDHIAATVTNDSISLIPQLNWYGQESLILTITSPDRMYNPGNTQFSKFAGSRNTIIDTLQITIASVNDLPVLSLGHQTFGEWEEKSIDISQNISDADNLSSEIIVTAVNSTHIGVTVNNHVIEFIPSPDWFGQEMVEFRLSNPERSLNSISKTRSSRTNSDYSTYRVDVSIVSSIPVITDCLTDNGYPVIQWNPIAGASSYIIEASNSPSGGFEVIRSTNETQFIDIVCNSPKRFYRIKAIKGNPVMKRQP